MTARDSASTLEDGGPASLAELRLPASPAACESCDAAGLVGSPPSGVSWAAAWPGLSGCIVEASAGYRLEDGGPAADCGAPGVTRDVASKEIKTVKPA